MSRRSLISRYSITLENRFVSFPSSSLKGLVTVADLSFVIIQLLRVIFEAAVNWAGKAGKSNFWSLSRTPAKGAPRDAGVRTDECVELLYFPGLLQLLMIGMSDRDHAQLEKMRQLGMKPEDEYKLSAMRDYINKLAAARQA